MAAITNNRTRTSASALRRRLPLVATLLMAALAFASSDLAAQCNDSSLAPYVEKEWGYLINAWEGIYDPSNPTAPKSWTCNGLKYLSGTANPDPADRCYIDVPPGKTPADTAARYLMNGAKPVYVEHKDGTKYLVFYVQQNNQTGFIKEATLWSAPWDDPEGPASWIELGGDEFIVFKAPATDAGARGVGLELRNDHLRPDNGNNHQFKSAFWEKDRGTNGKMTVFVKETIDEKGVGILVNKINWQRVDDPFDVKPLGYQTVLWNCQSPCPECVTAGMTGSCASGADVHPYRLTDIHMVDNEAPGSFWDTIGFLSWARTDNGQLGITPIRIDKTLGIYEVREDIGDSVGRWKRYNWGAKLDVPLQRTVQGRASDFSKVVTFSGVRYQLWRIRSTTPGGHPPCDKGTGTPGTASPTYTANMSDYGGTSRNGKHLDLYTIDADPEVLSVIDGPWTMAGRSGSRLHQHPSDYPAGLTWISGLLQLPPQGGQTIGNRYVYAGTRDPLICEKPSTSSAEKGTGKGVWWAWAVFPNEDCGSPVGYP